MLLVFPHIIEGLKIRKSEKKEYIYSYEDLGCVEIIAL
jgi:hypothetical protein